MPFGFLSCFSAPQVSCESRSLVELCHRVSALLRDAERRSQEKLDEGRAKLQPQRAPSNTIHRPLHQLMAAAVELRLLSLLPPLLDDLRLTAPRLFARDPPVLAPESEPGLSSLVFIAARLKDFAELQALAGALSQLLGSDWALEAANEKLCHARGVPRDLVRLVTSPRVRSRLLSEALGGAEPMSLICRENLDSAESSPVRPGDRRMST
ncbi:hypothetical protein WJX73_010327 [Symbiochloris irregularis]|uniref:Uncharacterized protein n=1 Tax=Symbiochloris irregularis TaxID=706552 RepID=A0AAW1PLX6_9CHLO